MIPLNPEMLAYAYEYLCCTPPFEGWNLPASEDIKFIVLKTKDRMGHHCRRNGMHHIAISRAYIGRHMILLETMAHEMIHLHMSQTCWNRRNPHDAAFSAYADQVCKIHEFDRLTF
jgi:hypothetical protein